MTTAGLAAQVLIFGVAGVWLLALVPAAIVTALKGQWLLLGFGWLTLGILWFVGAASLAPPDSLWARRFYGSERLARAANPLRHPRRRRNLGLAIAGAAVATLMLGFLAARPAPILGVGGGSLQSAVGNGGFLGTETHPCERLAGGAWSCSRWDDQFSGTVSYRVKVNRLGCWKATRVGPPGEGSKRSLSGCVTILNYVLR